MRVQLQSIKEFSSSLNEDKKMLAQVSGVHHSSATFLLPQMLEQFGKFSVIICATADDAAHIANDLEFFAPFFFPENTLPQISLFPGWEISPYKKLNPSVSARIQRLRVLHSMHHCVANQPQIIVTYTQALTQRAVDANYFKKCSISVKKGDLIDPTELSIQLQNLGYQKVEPVEDPGTFSIRGGIIDIFSPAHDWPMRIDLFDIEVESVRFYNPNTQRSIENTQKESFYIIPLREFDCSQKTLDEARANIKEWADTADIPRTIRDRVTEPLSKGIVTLEMDYLIPFFQTQEHSLFNHFSENPTVIWMDEHAVKNSWQQFWEKQEAAFVLSKEKQEIIPEPEKMYISLEKILILLNQDI